MRGPRRHPIRRKCPPAPETPVMLSPERKAGDLSITRFHACPLRETQRQALAPLRQLSGAKASKRDAAPTISTAPCGFGARTHPLARKTLVVPGAPAALEAGATAGEARTRRRPRIGPSAILPIRNSCSRL